MPESHRSRFDHWTLREAHAQGFLVRIRCTGCRITRLYQPADLIQIFGNRSQERLTWGIRCEKCGDKEFLRAEFYYPYAPDLQDKTIRRLVGIKIIRRPIWRDEPA